MRFRKAASILLSGAMAAGLLAGCGASEGDTAETSAVSDTSEETSSEFTGFDEMITIEMYGVSFYGDDGLEEVMDEINAISEAEINVHVNYTPLDVATYMEQIGLMMSGGESFDLVLCTAMPVVSFQTMQSQSQLMDISEYLDVYGTEVSELMSDYLSSMTIGDAIYGIPCYRSYDSSYYILMRTDILEELDLVEEAEAIDSWSDYEALLQKVADAQDELPEEMQTNAVISNQDGEGSVFSGLSSNIGSDDFSENYGYDCLSDST